MMIIFRGATFFGSTYFTHMAEGTKLMNWLCGADIRESLLALHDISLEDVQNLLK